MKIEKGYAISQFIDFIKSDDAAFEFSEGHMNYIPDEYKFEMIEKYNDFLKQPLKKEMFVNEVELPIDHDWQHRYEWANAQNSKWQDAEKRVIFEGWNKSVYNRWFVVGGIHEINFSNLDFMMYHNCTYDKYYKVETIHDLLETTKGELKLKNVEL